MKITIDDAGLTRPRQDEIQADLEANYRAIFGQDIDLSASSVDGQLIGVLSEMVSDVVQLLEDVYASRSIPGARGDALSRLVKLAGIQRNVASYTTSPVTHTGTPGTVIPDGTLIDDTSTPAQHFVTVGDATIGTDGQVIGAVRATTTGVIYAPAGTITVIVNPIAGWTSVTNTSPAIPGSTRELDSALRVRFSASLAVDSKSILDGIYSALANIPGVSDAVIFENKTGSPIARPGSTDLPPNSIQVVVLGGADAAIAQAIWSKVSGGVILVGASSYSVTDSQGIAQVIKFDRPTDIPIQVLLTVNKGANAPYPTVTKLQSVKQALADYGNSVSRIGRNVIWSALFEPIMEAFAGTGVTTQFLFIGRIDGTGVTAIARDLAIPFTGRAAWDPGRIQILVGTNVPL